MIHLYSILALAGIAYCFASADAAPDDPSAVDGVDATFHEMTLVFALMASYFATVAVNPMQEIVSSAFVAPILRSFLPSVFADDLC